MCSTNYWEMGSKAYLLGKHTNDNPFQMGSKEYEEWRDGWFDEMYLKSMRNCSD